MNKFAPRAIRFWKQLFPQDDPAARNLRHQRACVATLDLTRRIRVLLAAGSGATDGALTIDYALMHNIQLSDSIGGPAMETGPRRLALCVDALAIPAGLRANMERYAREARSQRTIESYDSKLHTLAALVEPWGSPVVPMAPAVVCAAYAALADAGYTAKSIDQFRSALRFAHKLTGHPDPTVALECSLVFEGIKRVLGTAPINRKAALLLEDVRALLVEAAIPHTVKAAQQCAMIALSWHGAYRRAEINAFNVDDITFESDGRMRIYIARSKTDQYGKGAWMWIAPTRDDPAICPVRHLRRWLRILGTSEGPLFRRLVDQHAIRTERVDKNWLDRQLHSLARRVGFPPERIGTHSLRAGWATQAVLDGVSDVAIAQHLRHTDLHTLPIYFRPGARRYDASPNGRKLEA